MAWSHQWRAHAWEAGTFGKSSVKKWPCQILMVEDGKCLSQWTLCMTVCEKRCICKAFVSVSTTVRRISQLSSSCPGPQHTLHGWRTDGRREKHGALRPLKPLTLIRDGEVWGSGIFISNTYSLHCHHQNDSALRWAVVWAIFMFH